ncbi:MAG: hypothetical protein AAGD38_04715 [Acidobacteriota bacterium]
MTRHQERQDELRRATGAAMRRLPSDRGSVPNVPTPGALLTLPATADHAVEWFVVERTEHGRFIVVPTDTHELAGSTDLEIDNDPRIGPLTLRCAYPVEIAAPLLAAGHESGRLDQATVNRARDLLKRIDTDDLDHSVEVERIDGSIEYRDWLEDVVEPAVRALRSAAAPTKTKPLRPVNLWLAVAAVTFFLLSVFLVSENLEMQDQIDRNAASYEDAPLVRIMAEVMRSENSPTETEIEPRKRVQILYIPWLPVEEDARYRFELLDADGRIIQERPGAVIESSELTIVRIWIPPLEPGRYELRVDDPGADEIMTQTILVGSSQSERSP